MKKNITINDNEMIFMGLPLPPTSNHQYTPIRAGNKTRFISSDNLNAFKEEMRIYRLENLLDINDAIFWLRDKRLFALNRYYCFHKSSLFTKMNTIKRLDVTNRIKAFDDCLCDILVIDDKQIWSGTEEKILIRDHDKECVIIKITTARSRTKEELIKLLTKGV